jgi:hypothetical protein
LTRDWQLWQVPLTIMSELSSMVDEWMVSWTLGDQTGSVLALGDSRQNGGTV